MQLAKASTATKKKMSSNTNTINCTAISLAGIVKYHTNFFVKYTKYTLWDYSSSKKNERRISIKKNK